MALENLKANPYVMCIEDTDQHRFSPVEITQIVIQYPLQAPIRKVIHLGTRPLSSITDEEAREAFRVAIFESEDVFHWRIEGNGDFDIFDRFANGFTLSPKGILTASCFMDITQSINAVALVDYLRSIGISFESVT